MKRLKLYSFLPFLLLRFDLLEYDFTLATKPQTYHYGQPKEFRNYSPHELCSLSLGRVQIIKPLRRDDFFSLGFIGFKLNYLTVEDEVNSYDHLKVVVPVELRWTHRLRTKTDHVFLYGAYFEFSSWGIKGQDNPYLYMDYGMNFDFYLTPTKSDELLGTKIGVKLGQISMFYDYNPPVDLTSWYVSLGVICGWNFEIKQR